MKVLVTGGGGFLGTRIALTLREQGDSVVAFGRSSYPHLEQAGIDTIHGDIRNLTDIVAACKGVDAVYHVAALAGIWGRTRDFQSINVDGTRNVINACHVNRVRSLIYTSSPSVVFGSEGLCGVNESQPYPAHFLADYPATKAAAEKLVLAANSSTLATVALRPHLIWGLGDPHLIPRVIARARSGQLAQVGDGTNLVDITYVDNAADAHVAAGRELAGSKRCAGKAYFISQGEPVSLWPWLAGILAAVGAPKISRTVSYRAAYLAGTVLELAYRTLRKTNEPRMTRFLASQLAKSHYFNISASKRDFGYVPKVTTEEGLKLLIPWLRGEEPSKSEQLTKIKTTEREYQRA